MTTPRIAAMFAGLEVKDMVPYNMPTEIVVGPSTSGTAFPGSDLLNTVGMPFSVFRLVPRVMALTAKAIKPWVRPT